MDVSVRMLAIQSRLILGHLRHSLAAIGTSTIAKTRHSRIRCFCTMEGGNVSACCSAGPEPVLAALCGSPEKDQALGIDQMNPLLPNWSPSNWAFSCYSG